MTDRYSTYILLSIIAFVIVGLLTVNNETNIQNEKYERLSSRYYSSLQQINEKNPQEARKILTDLKVEYPKRYNIYRYIGLTNVMLEDYEEAIINYEEALKIKPFLQVDPLFMIQYAESYFFNNQYKEAEYLLGRFKELPRNEYSSKAEQLLQVINHQ